MSGDGLHLVVQPLSCSQISAGATMSVVRLPLRRLRRVIEGGLVD